jgi:glycosyltransferase involved in cell wall biosynthesis
MNRRKRIAVCTAQVPFVSGGAEIHVESLVRELKARDYDVELVRLPFKWYPHEELIKGCLAWRLVDITASMGRPIDLAIATKFPSYVVRHPNKVVWLIHQYRAAYDLYGTQYSELTPNTEDENLRSIIRRIDQSTLGEAQRIFTNSRNTARRLARYNSLHGEPLYHPPKHDGRYHNAGYDDYIFAVSRLEALKRLDGLVRALVHTCAEVRCLIAGTGPMRAELERLANKLGVSDRVEFLGYVDDEQLVQLYANCFAVYYAPFDEDYGYVTLEAFKSRKPVLTAPDSGGVLEFVDDAISGYVVTLDEPARMGERINQLYTDRRLAARLGEAGFEQVAGITWDYAIKRLTETL